MTPKQIASVAFAAANPAVNWADVTSEQRELALRKTEHYLRHRSAFEASLEAPKRVRGRFVPAEEKSDDDAVFRAVVWAIKEIQG